MKIIFLDIDGVLNSGTYFANCAYEGMHLYRYFDKEKMELLVKIIEETQAKVVLSSSWRSDLDENLYPIREDGERLLAVLAAHGIELYSKTGRRMQERSDEIRGWLKEHPETTHFVILDDEIEGQQYNDWYELEPHFVKTIYEVGLTPSDAETAIKILLHDDRGY